MHSGYEQIHFVFYDTALYKCMMILLVSEVPDSAGARAPASSGLYEAVPQLYAAGPPSSVTLRFLRGHCAVLTRELHHQQATINQCLHSY